MTWFSGRCWRRCWMSSDMVWLSQWLFLDRSSAWFRACGAGVLSFASPKESSQRKGDPRLRGRLRRLPCATRRAGRLRNSVWLRQPSDSPRRKPPALLRCSALHMGTPKPASAQPPFVDSGIPLALRRFFGPLGRRRATQGSRGKSSRVSRAAGEFSETPDCPSSAGDRAQPGADPGVAFSLATFFLPPKRKYARAASAEPTG